MAQKVIVSFKEKKKSVSFNPGKSALALKSLLKPIETL